MTKSIHPNIKTLIDRMENAFQRNDFALVLKTSSDVFETLAKDIVNNPNVQNQPLGSFYPLFRKESLLPKEILDYIFAVYKDRNVTPLAGHGSTELPSISKATATFLCEFTKAVVNSEYKSRNLNVVSFNDTELQQEIILFKLSLTDKGIEKELTEELKASFVEAIYYAKKGSKILFEVSYLPLELIEEIINSPQFSSSDPNTRIAKVELRRIADYSRERKVIMERALNLISTKSIINQISDVTDLISVINGIPQLLAYYSIDYQRNKLIETFFDAHGEFLDNYQTVHGTKIEIFHKNLQLVGRFYINKKEADNLIEQLNLISSIDQLVGRGWQMYDLTDEIKFPKAIPAILLEIVDSKIIEDINIDLDEVLHPSYWQIGKG